MLWFYRILARGGQLRRVPIRRHCLPPSLCATQNQLLSFSDADFTVTASVHCCKTNGCNSQDAVWVNMISGNEIRTNGNMSVDLLSLLYVCGSVSDPDPGQRNGIQCFACSRYSEMCNSTVECVGAQTCCKVSSHAAYWSQTLTQRVTFWDSFKLFNLI